MRTSLTDAAAETEIERLIVAMRPLTADILARYTRSGRLLTREDAEDITATVQMRLVLKLREVAASPETEAIHDLHGYVATLTYNAMSDHLRKRFPERARLKARLRYALTHDRRLALWMSARGPACGLAGWQGREDVAEEVTRQAVAVIAPADRDDAGSALVELFRVVQGPVLLDAAVDAVAEGWTIVEQDPLPLDERITSAAPSHEGDLEFVRALWSEIRELRPMQRKALLLNLRCAGETNIVSLLVLARIARFDEIAAALEMSPAELAAVWKSLPIEDNEIAGRFGISRQQVINLRRAARDRLWRRLRR